MTSREDKQRRVAKGARRLDRAKPGWYTRIDTDRLSMWSGKRCILGQLYGEYWVGRQELFEWYELGSAARPGVLHGFAGMGLKKLWLKEIRVRLDRDRQREKELVNA